MEFPEKTTSDMPRAIKNLRLNSSLPRRCITAIFTALLVVLIGSRVNPVQPLNTLDPAAEDCLGERAADVAFDSSSLDAAVQSLQKSFKTPLRLDTHNRFTNGKGIVFHRKNVTLAYALARVLRQFDKEGDELLYDVQDGQVRIADDGPDSKMLLRIYDISSWFDGEPFAPQWEENFAGRHSSTPAESIESFLMQMIAPPIWQDQGGMRNAWIKVWNHSLVVSAPASVQWEIQQLCFQMNHAAPVHPANSKTVPK